MSVISTRDMAILGTSSRKSGPSRTASRKAVAPEDKPLISREGSMGDGDSDSDCSSESDGGIYVKLMVKSTKKFQQDLMLALRASFFIVVCGSPFLIPRGEVEFVDRLIISGIYTSSCVINFVYTLYRTVGETSNNAIAGIKGTVLATLNIWVMFAIFPGGAAEAYGLAWWIGALEGVLFILCLLWLNWDMNTSVFAISTWVWYWMDFLHPTDGMHYTSGFAFSMTNKETAGLFTATVGSLLAIVATCIPYPLWALSRAVSTAQELVNTLPEVWQSFAEHFCEERANIYRQDQIVHDLNELQAQMGKMQGHIANSWWESFGISHKQKIRTTLTAVDKFLTLAYDGIFSAWTACTLQEWGPMHKDIMDNLKIPIGNCIGVSQDLVDLCLKAACDGDIDDSEELAMRDFLQKLGEAQEALTEALVTTRQKLELPLLSEDTLVEPIFCLSLFAFCQHVSAFARELLDIDDLPPVQELPGGLAALFEREVLFDRDHLEFVLKNSIAILVSFAIGYMGYEALGLQPYSASLSSTASLLMSKALGSAINKNLQRVEGVVLGTVVGQVLHRLFLTCSWDNAIVLALVLIVYSCTTLFVYYNSVSFSFVGCLLAGFGSGRLLGGCRDASHSPKHSGLLGGYNVIVTTVIAATLILVSDLSVSRERASAMAHRAIVDAWRCIEDAMGKCFDPKVRATRSHRQAILSKIDLAKSLGLEAAMEPRYWRTAWHAHTFDEAISRTYKVRYCLTALENSIAEDLVEGGMKLPFIVELEADQHFRGLVDLLLTQVSVMETYLKFFVHEEAGPMPEFTRQEVTRDYSLEAAELMGEFIDEVLRSGKLESSMGRHRGRGLAEDPACQVAFVIGSLTSIMYHVRRVRESMLRE